MSIIFLLFLITYFSGEFSNYSKGSRNEAIDNIASSIKIELDTAVSVHNGYERKFILPEKVSGKSYVISRNDMELTGGTPKVNKLIKDLQIDGSLLNFYSKSVFDNSEINEIVNTSIDELKQEHGNQFQNHLLFYPTFSSC